MMRRGAWWLGALGLCALLVLATAVARGQTAADAWSPAVNISLSGGASAPQIVVDAAGTAHALWRVRNGTLLYARANRDGAWSQPVVVETPFATDRFNTNPNQPPQLYTPQLVATPDGALHAFWTAADGALYTSAVSPAEFSSFNNWSARVQLGAGATAFDATAGPDGRLHLAYARTAEPAGLYYLRGTPTAGATGQLWSEPRRLDASGYFRSLDAATAHVQTAAGQSAVYIAYDLRGEERVYLAYSADGGERFAAPRLIAERQPDDRSDAVGPRELRAAARGDRALLVWQAGDATEACRVRAQWSADDGRSWQAADLPATAALCPSPTQRSANPPAAFAARPFAPPGALSYLLLVSAGGADRQAQLLAWDGALWSNPQPLPTQIDNPVTFRSVALGCHAPAWQPPDRLLLLTCAADGNGDIWAAARSIPAEQATWFPTPTLPPPWQLAGDGATLDAAPDRLQVVPAADGRLLAFSGGPGSATLELTVWDGARWSRPAPVLTSPGGRAGAFSAALLGGDQVAVAWEDLTDGRIYTARSLVARATSPGDWSSPVVVPAPRQAAGGPSLVVDRAGRLWLAFTIAVNEQRGIYVASSDDGGATWSAPVFVFDGAAAGWERVDAPQLAVGAGGDLHLLWSRGATNPDLPALELRYSRSSDGVVWSGALRVVDGAIGWRALLAVGEQVVHRFWVAAQGNRPQLAHAVSLDGGLNWSSTNTVAGTALPLGASADAAGQVHLVTYENGALTRRIWQDGRWGVAEAQATAAELVRAPLALAGSGDALWAASASAADDETSAVVRLWRLGVALPDQLPTPLPTLTPTPTPDVGTPTPPPLPSATPTFPVAPPTPGLTVPGLPTDSPIGLIALASIPAVLIVALSLATVLRRRR